MKNSLQMIASLSVNSFFCAKCSMASLRLVLSSRLRRMSDGACAAPKIEDYGTAARDQGLTSSDVVRFR